MTQFFTKTLFLVAFCAAHLLHAQTKFWSQDFSAGLPASWTTADASNQNITWKWCGDPAAGRDGTGCSPIFSENPNFQKTFGASTPTNGFVTVDSDLPGKVLPKAHIAQLTTAPINCTGRNQVFLTFQTHIGVYTVNAEQGALVRVSTDKVNWTEFTVFSGLTTDDRWSENPEEVFLDISGVADNQPAVYVQWQWTGNWEYFWNVDDVELYQGGNPAPRHNLAVSRFFYPASNFKTPVGLIARDTFGFFAYLSNKGLSDATNVVLTAIVEDESKKELFKDSLKIAALAAGTQDSLFELTGIFAPNLPVGTYSVSYRVRADSVDQRPLNNQGSSPFVVSSESVFAKEDLPKTYTRTTQDIGWSVGNYYQMPTGLLDQYRAMRAAFAFDTDPDEMALTDVNCTVYLLKVKDEIAADFSNFEQADYPGTSVDIVGLAGYQAPNDIVGGTLQTAFLIDAVSGDDGVLLQPGGRYFLMATYPDNAKQTNHAFNTSIEYVGQTSTVLYTDEWYLGGFGEEYAAVMRMQMDLLVTTDEKPLPESALSISPNPIQDAVVNLDIRFAIPTDATITLADLNGRVLRIEQREGLLSERVPLSMPTLAAGTYLARIATKAGTRTVQFSKL